MAGHQIHHLKQLEAIATRWRRVGRAGRPGRPGGSNPHAYKKTGGWGWPHPPVVVPTGL